MKQTIEIEVPDGKKAVWKDNKVVFEDIKPKFPKTWEEFCEQNGIKKSEYYLDTSSCIIEIGDSKRHNGVDKNVLPSKKAAEQHLALMQLHQLRDCYNNNWHCDWNNEHEKNAVIVRSHGELKIYAEWAITTFLTFKSIEIAREFLTNFRELIEQAGDLI